MLVGALTDPADPQVSSLSEPRKHCVCCLDPSPWKASYLQAAVAVGTERKTGKTRRPRRQWPREQNTQVRVCTRLGKRLHVTQE